VSHGARRTRRGRSSRSRRRWTRLVVVLFLLAVTGFAALQIATRESSPSEYEITSSSPQGNLSGSLAGLVAQNNFDASRPTQSQVVYPYSVVPGGVQSPQALQSAASRDTVVARHYSGFNYKRAQVIEVQEPKLVYLSYRLHDKIYWTSKQIRLHRGEKLITDGKITARTRCGNRVSESAQKAVSPQEPPAEKFDQPYLADGGTATQAPFPGTFESVLRTPPAFDGGGTGLPPLTSSYLFGPGASIGYPPLFPPPLPSGDGGCTVTLPGREKDGAVENSTTRHPCPKHPGPGPGPGGGGPPPPPVVPEPGTILLFASGAAGIYWRYKKLPKK